MFKVSSIEPLSLDQLTQFEDQNESRSSQEGQIRTCSFKKSTEGSGAGGERLSGAVGGEGRLWGGAGAGR